MQHSKLHSIILILCVILFFSCSDKVTVTEYGVFAPSRLHYVKGQDGVTPIDFDGKHTMWTFGDTITHEGMIANSLAFTDKVDACNVRQLQFHYYTENEEIVPFIRNDKDEDSSRDRLWAFDGIRIHNTVYVYYAHVYIHDPLKPLSFSLMESSVAHWDVPYNWSLGKPVHFKRLKNLFTGDVPALGASVLHYNDYVYVVGHISKNGKSSLVIARVKPQHILQRDTYSFLQGDSSWKNTVTAAIQFYGDVAGECSLGYDENYKLFYIVYCQLFSGNIVMSIAPSIEQLPFAKKIIVYTPAKLKGTSMMYYSAKEILRQKNQRYIIYINPIEYQPYLIQVKINIH